jgi:HlyD family secretion protein
MTEPTTARPANGELVNRVQQLRLNTQLGAGKSARGGTSWLPWVLCGLLALSWAGVGIRGYKTGAFAPAAAASSATAAGPEGSSGKAAVSGPVIPGTIEISESGYLVPAQTIAVSPIDVGGRVVELNVIEGKLFKKGAVLARLEDTNYKAQVAEAVASLRAAEKRLEAAKMKLAVLMPESVRKIEMDQAEEEVKEADAQRERANDQYLRLSKLGPGVSEQELRQARYDFDAAAAKARRLAVALVILKEGPRQEMKAGAEADVKSAEADVKGAEARLIQAQWRLDNCTITAPIDGTILNKKAELGNLVNPMAFSASTSGGGAVCDMANLADMEADLEISEREIGKLVVGQRCRVKCPVAPDLLYEGRLDRIRPTGNRAKNIVNVRVKVKLPEGEVPGSILKPEMRAEVAFLAEQK